MSWLSAALRGGIQLQRPLHQWHQAIAAASGTGWERAAARSSGAPVVRALAAFGGGSAAYATHGAPPPAKRLGLAEVKHIIAVASGKGGVGKSTVAANLAVALATRLGLGVGLVDADIHGPSIPTLMNLEGEPLATPEGLMLAPENYNVKVMSMGFFTEGDAPIVWRGPMATKAMDKLLLGTAWGDLDVLVVDMPPGTGDAQINLGQRLPLSGAVIVSTPQDVALLDARRGAQMFKAVRVPLLGLVDNMAAFTCPACGHKEAVFGAGGVQRAAEELGLDVLGQVPLDAAVRLQSDEGVPIVVASPESASAQAYVEIAHRVWGKLQALESGGGPGGGGPKITVG
ncbi:MAG: P-loop containing nucleoside triphosphate hydrolase protein [Monoraphidium minutum]|nr:MAG: P-loop containing nucleoside triphosphate hydrolase protein [Monoraphidium minutum]